MRDPASVTHHYDAETRAVLASVVLTAQRALPDLAVTVTADTTVDWTVDRCCTHIWLNRALPPSRLIDACLEAVADLKREKGRFATGIPQQRNQSPILVR